MKNFKKTIATLMVVTTIFCSGCSFKQPEAVEKLEVETEVGTVLGGWNVKEDTTVTEDVKRVFDKATEALLGVDYEPVSYLASQVVAGTNHCILCKATVVVPNAEPSYVLMYVYEDLQGNAEILEIQDVKIGIK